MTPALTMAVIGGFCSLERMRRAARADVVLVARSWARSPVQKQMRIKVY